jgi:hypothetical protein
MSYPKQSNLQTKTLTAPATLDGAENCLFAANAGSYTLPALSTVIDGHQLVIKHTGASGSVIWSPAGSDTIDGGATASVTLTSAGAGLGLGAILVASKGASSTWWRTVKAQ